MSLFFKSDQYLRGRSLSVTASTTSTTENHHSFLWSIFLTPFPLKRVILVFSRAVFSLVRPRRMCVFYHLSSRGIRTECMYLVSGTFMAPGQSAYLAYLVSGTFLWSSPTSSR